MSRLVQAPASVTSLAKGWDGKPWPLTITCRGSRYRADLADKRAEMFKVVGEWWNDPNAVNKPPPDSEFYRLPLIGGGMVELVKQPDGSWLLWKVYD